MWSFGKQSNWAVRNTPKNADFFIDAESSVAEDLVREVTQNSLDAVRPDMQAVTVRFRFGQMERAEFKMRYMAKLEDHLAACDPAASAIIAEAGLVPFLAVEDFGTRGLDGPADRVTEASNYNRFWWSYGDSAKGGGDGGRHGVGKSTIAESSLLKFFFGMTVRADDKQAILTGQTVLRPHHMPNDDQTWFEPYGFFAATHFPDDPEPFKSSDPAFASFCSDFKVDRGSDPGLSLVIPFVQEQVTKDAVVNAVVRHCFHQIASGQLVVHIDDVQLTHDTLPQFATKDGSPLAGLKSAIDLSLEVTGASKPQVIVASGTHLGDRLSVVSDKVFTPEQIAALRATWAAGEIVGVTIPVRIEMDTKPAEFGQVALYLRRASAADQAAETYVRGRVTVTLTARIATQNAVALLAADPGSVSKFLGDSEKPNHRDWMGRRAEARGYKNPYLPLRIIKNALRDLHALVTQTDEAQVVKDVLKEFFNTPAPVGAPKPQPHKPKPPNPVPPSPEPEEEALSVTKTKGGFKVLLRGEDGSKAKFRVTVKYDVRRGKAKWSKADFDMTSKPIKARKDGEGEAAIYPDSIVVQSASPGFSLTVSGFDPNRDLRVRAELEDADV